MSLADPVLGGLARLSLQAMAAASGPRLSILIFHRVLPQVDPLFPLEVDAARFDRLMALVARGWQVLPLAEAAQRLAEGRLPPRAMSITFDDGYADNHDLALPILQRHGLSACFFIATGFLEGGRMFNDTVIECVRNSPLARLDLAEFGLGEFPLDTPQQRAAAIGKLLPVIKYLGPEDRPAALARVQALCRPTRLPDDLMMTHDQVRRLHAAGMEIGAHTVRHPILCSIDDAQVEAEIDTSRRSLQDIIGAPVSLFAYPNGRPDRDYAHRHAEIVRRLGFRAAVSTAPGVATPGADMFQLPRLTPWYPQPSRWLARLIASRMQRGFSVATPAWPAGPSVAGSPPA